jgi:hypothetical protein
VVFSREDLVEFAKTNFRSWKKNWKADNDPELGRKRAKAESKGRQEMRRKEASSQMCLLCRQNINCSIFSSKLTA